MPTSYLPASIPSASSLLRRTQSALGLMREIVQESSAEHWYMKGKEAIAHKKWDEAQYCFDLCLKIDYNHWRGTLQIALVAAYAQQKNRACSMLLKSYEMRYSTYIEFSNELTPQQWSDFHLILDKAKDTGEDNFDNLLALTLAEWLNPNQEFSPPLQIKLVKDSLNKIKKNHYKEASLSALWNRLSGTYRNLNYKTECIEGLYDYNQAVFLSPEHATAYHERGHFKQFYFDDYNGALSDYNKSIELDPNQANTYCARATVHTHLEAHSEALKDYSKAIEIEPKHSYSYAGRARTKNKLNDREGAIIDHYNHINIILDSNKPHFSNASSHYMHIGSIKVEMLDYIGALADFNKAFDLNPKPRSHAYFERGYVKHKLHDFEGALSDYSVAIEYVGNGAKPTIHLARIETNEILGKYTDALIDCDTLINSHPYVATFYTIRSRFKEIVRDFKGAQDDIIESSRLMNAGYRDYFK